MDGGIGKTKEKTPGACFSPALLNRGAFEGSNPGPSGQRPGALTTRPSGQLLNSIYAQALSLLQADINKYYIYFFYNPLVSYSINPSARSAAQVSSLRQGDSRAKALASAQTCRQASLERQWGGGLPLASNKPTIGLCQY